MNIKYKKLAGVSTLLFPILLLVGFILHPDLTSFEITKTAEGLISKFYNQPMFHIGHLIVFIAVPFIVVNIIYLMTISPQNGQNLLFIGGVLGVLGAVILAGDKGALCLVLSAFDTLSERDIYRITPALDSIIKREGLLVIFYLLTLLPVGASIQLVGLIKSSAIKKVYGILGIIGLMLLNNPDIEIISSVGAILMCVVYIPLGINILKNKV